MKIKFVFFCLIVVSILACVDDKNVPSTNTPAIKEKQETKTTFIREPLDIVPSTGEDYPQSLKELGFPILPGAEVSNVGNTDIENGTVVLQMETLASVDQIKSFFRKEFAGKKWVEKEMKVYQGADNAISFRTDEHSIRIMLINDKIQDFRKIAVTLNKRVKHKDFQ